MYKRITVVLLSHRFIAHGPAAGDDNRPGRASAAGEQCGPVERGLHAFLDREVGWARR